MIPIANVAPLITLAVVIYNQVGTAKKNVRYCRRLAEEVKAMEPILRDIEARVDQFPQVTKEMIDRALDLLLKDYQAALEFIKKQNKTNAIKKFVIAKTTEEDFQDINNHIRDSRDIFMLAMVNKIDTKLNAPARKPLPPAPNRVRAESSPVPVTHTTTTTESSSDSPTSLSPRSDISDPTTSTETPIPISAPTTPTSSTDNFTLPPTSVPNRVFVGGRQSPDLSSHSSSPDISHQSTIKRKMDEMRQAFNEKKYDTAVKIGKELLKKAPPGSETSFIIYISIACSHAITNALEDAMTYLYSAKENGWDDLPYLECEDLNNLRSFPEFIIFKEKLTQELLQKERWRTMPQDQVDLLTRNFERYDVDGSGTICLTEFRVLMKRTSVLSLTEKQVDDLFGEMDKEKTGQVDLNGYLNYMADHRDNVDSFTKLTNSTAQLQDVTACLQDFSLSPSVVPQSLGDAAGFLNNYLYNSSPSVPPPPSNQLHQPPPPSNQLLQPPPPSNQLLQPPPPSNQLHSPTTSHSPYHSNHTSPTASLSDFSLQSSVHSLPPGHSLDSFPSSPNPQDAYASHSSDAFSSASNLHSFSPAYTPPVHSSPHPTQSLDPNYSPHASAYHSYSPYASHDPHASAAYHSLPTVHTPPPHHSGHVDPYAHAAHASHAAAHASAAAYQSGYGTPYYGTGADPYASQYYSNGYYHQ